MSDLGSGIPLVELVNEVAAVGAPSVLPRLGAFVLVGQVDEDEPVRWAFSTAVMVAPALSEAVGAGLDFERGVVYPLVKRTSTFPTVLLLGRSSSNDVQIAHHSVSKLHARIRVGGNAFELEDAGSLNGTFLGETRLEARVTLTYGDRVGFGTQDFTVHDSTRFLDILDRIGPL